MDNEQFWQVIEDARTATTKTRDVPAWLTSHLKSQSLEYLTAFRLRFHEVYCQAYDERLWIAAELILGGCSDDKFSDFLGWLIAKGKRVYESAVQNPDTMCDVDTTDGEHGKPLLFYMAGAAPKAYAEKVGDRIASMPIVLKTPVLLNENSWDGDRSKLQSIYPKLWVKYQGPRSAPVCP